MRKLCLLFFFVSFMIPLNSQKTSTGVAKAPLIEKSINSHWTFNYFPEEKAGEGYESPGYDDSKWPVVSIPHTWMTYETTREMHPFIRNAAESENPYWWTGWGWYRKHFSVNKEFSGKKVFIEFEGVQKYCKVWINGKYLGDHKGGYGSFDFDLTGFINEGKDNVLAVAVSNKQKDQFRIPPVTAGKFNVYGGIYRNVTIVLKDKLYIPMQGAATHEGGTFVTTPEVSEKEGIVRIQTWVKNDYSQPKDCILNTYILDAANKTVQVLTSINTINPGQLFKFDQTSKPVRNPRLWSDENPYLYKIRSELVDGKTIADTYISPLGFRWFRWECKTNTLYLNGNKIAIQSGTLHQEYPWLGDATPEWVSLMDIKYIADNLNYNFIRTAYCPNERLVYDLSDKYGIIVLEESPGIRDQEFSAEVQDQQLKEMIRRDRNHPSIIFWSTGNESSYVADSKSAKAEDPTRILISRRVPDYSAVDYVTSTDESASCAVTFNEKTIDNSTLSAFSINGVTSQVVKPGEPAKIILSGSHQKISADRSSVATITANIVDLKGMRIYNADNNIKWTVTGPATLAGPSAFVSDIYKHQIPDGFRYLDMPVSNVIRSTGKPGKIRVTVLASGLASGSFEIEAEEIMPDNSVITEPILSDEGRKPVAKAMLTFERLDDLPGEIKLSGDEFNAGSSDRSGYTGIIREYIMKNNPAVDSSSVEFRTLVNLFASYLLNNSGRLAAVDYNFSVEHYNNCRLISRYINATRLPALFKEGLKNYYADAVIRLGIEKNAGDEMNWMNWIPSGGTVVISQEGSTPSWPKGTIVTTKNELADLIAVVYPVFVKYNDEAKERALTFISKMNPYIQVTSAGEGVSYAAEKGKPILIPLIKFISE